jgi:hypothetical protein
MARPLPETSVRAVGAALVAATGAVHLWLYFDYFHEVHVVGILFLVNAASAAVLAAAILLVGSNWSLAAGIAFEAATLGAFVLSVYHGLFGYVESLSGGWQEAAAGIELAAIAALAAAAVSRRPQTVRRGPAYAPTRQAYPRRDR